MIPQILKSTDLQLITPCFCAGAHQTEPELRAASFRGELRWWFRCLGGSRELENTVFGNVHGACRASAVALCVLNVKRSPVSGWGFEAGGGNPKQPNSSYITYFLNANEKNGAEDKVVRSEAWLPPDQKFTLELRQLRELEPAALELLNLAWDCLCNLGAIGARKTRALGAYAPVNPAEQKVPELIAHATVRQHFLIKSAGNKDFGDFRSPAVTTSLLTACARRLKEYRGDLGIHPTLGKGQKAREGAYYGISALGNAIGGRQTSALRFRPVLIENKLFLYVLKAPDITLGAEARKHNLVLH